MRNNQAFSVAVTEIPLVKHYVPKLSDEVRAL
jgi:hypothetical protein